MAIQCSFPPHIITQQSVPLRKPLFGMVMFRKTLLPVKKAPKLQIRSSIKDQVFEDYSTGIICYKDDRGEIICEGLDEGPRLYPLYPTTPLPMRVDGVMIDLFQQRWMEIMGGETEDSSKLLGKRSCNGTIEYIPLNE